MNIVDIDALFSARRHLAVEYLGQAIEVWYDPNQFDEQLQVDMNRYQQMGDSDPEKLGLNRAILARLITAWNLGRDGEAVPPDEAIIGRMSLPLKGKLVKAIVDDLGLTDAPKSEPTSATTSSAAAGTAERQNGASSFAPAGISG